MKLSHTLLASVLFASGAAAQAQQQVNIICSV
jgi:hypothetical protein